MKRGYADTQFGQMHYLTQGEGPVVLVMHATTHSARMFSRFVPHLAEHYRVVAPDLFGFGNSDPLPEDCTMPDLAECMVELLDAVGAERAHVFGLHTGNKLGAAMGARTPNRVEKLLLCGLPHSIIPDEAERDAAISEYVEKSIVEFPPTDDGGHLLKEWGHLHGQITEAWWGPSVLSKASVSREDIDLLAEQVIAILQYRDSLAGIYDTNYAYDWTADLARIEPETMVLELGEAVELETYGSQVTRLTETIPDSQGTTLDGVTVRNFHESPERIARPTLEFFDE